MGGVLDCGDGSEPGAQHTPRAHIYWQAIAPIFASFQPSFVGPVAGESYANVLRDPAGRYGHDGRRHRRSQSTAARRDRRQRVRPPATPTFFFDLGVPVHVPGGRARRARLRQVVWTPASARRLRASAPADGDEPSGARAPRSARAAAAAPALLARALPAPRPRRDARRVATPPSAAAARAFVLAAVRARLLRRLRPRRPRDPRRGRRRGGHRPATSAARRRRRPPRRRRSSCRARAARRGRRPAAGAARRPAAVLGRGALGEAAAAARGAGRASAGRRRALRADEPGEDLLVERVARRLGARRPARAAGARSSAPASWRRRSSSAVGVKASGTSRRASMPATVPPAAAGARARRGRPPGRGVTRVRVGWTPWPGDRGTRAARRAADRAAAEGARRHEAVHALGRPPVLDLRRLPRGGHRHRRRPPRAVRGVRRRGLGEGHAQAGRRALTAGPGRDERDERARLRAAEPLADARARRPRAGDALGPGLAAGDRPRAVRAPADQARGDGRRRRRRSPALVDDALGARRCARTRGPAFLDFPLDHVFMEAEEPEPARRAPRRRRRPADGARSSARSRCCARPSGR